METSPPTEPVSTTAPAKAAARPVWSLAGGKGGVGRTVLAANLGIQLARAGRTVTLIDLDLQGGTLHGALGFTRLKRGLSQFDADPSARLTGFSLDTSIHRLQLIGGLQGSRPPVDPLALVQRIVEQLPDLPAEYILIDCGSGRASGTLAAFAAATLGIVVCTPEPAALESACLFAEAHLRACLETALPRDTRGALEDLLRADGIDPQQTTFRSLMTRIAAIDAAACQAVAQVVRRTRLELLVNQVRDEDDEEAGSALATSFRKCFGLELPIAGLVQHDPSVLQAVHKRRPLSQQFPNTLATKGMARAVGRLMAAAPQGIGDPAEEWMDLGEVDHYRVLEIDPKASPKEVQTAYQVMKKAFDPEWTHLSPLLDLAGLQAIQARVEESYRTLIFLESRVAYDRQMLQAGSLKADQVRGLHAAATSGAAEHAPASAPEPALQVGESGGTPESSGPPVAGEAASAPSSLPASEASPTPKEPAPAPLGSGAALRAERLRLGQTLEAIASRTKIRQTYLLAIEEDRFDALPPPVFLRGFVREFAACLGLAEDETARAYLLARERAQRLAAPAVSSSTRRSA